jgi:hypothetical protein
MVSLVIGVPPDHKTTQDDHSKAPTSGVAIARSLLSSWAGNDLP